MPSNLRLRAKLGAAFILTISATSWSVNANAEKVAILCLIPGLPPEIKASDPELYNPSTIKLELDFSKFVATAYNFDGSITAKNMPLKSSDKEFKFHYTDANGYTHSWTLDRTTLQLARTDTPNWIKFDLLNCKLLRKQL